MIPTQRTYGLLVAGGAIATLLTSFAGPARFSTGLLSLFCFDGALLLAMLCDVWQVKRQRVDVSRTPIQPRLRGPICPCAPR